MTVEVSYQITIESCQEEKELADESRRSRAHLVIGGAIALVGNLDDVDRVPSALHGLTTTSNILS